mmetsp:Transcript_49529/g.78425  ORF Transcript_49529/g.78425 Transcript_49529/m.78425 type:complete len:208 (+) Transcript_49529:66-689(+)
MGDHKDAWKQDVFMRGQLNKEYDSWQRWMASTGNFSMYEHDALGKSLSSSHGVLPTQDGVSSCYRCPMKGEEVTVYGIQRRGDLNGARGVIVDGGVDDRGRVVVRVYDNSAKIDSGSRRMRIKYRNLVPARPSILPPLAGSSGSQALASDGNSVCTASQSGGSIASSARRGSTRAELSMRVPSGASGRLSKRSASVPSLRVSDCPII